MNIQQLRQSIRPYIGLTVGDVVELLNNRRVYCHCDTPEPEYTEGWSCIRCERELSPDYMDYLNELSIESLI